MISSCAAKLLEAVPRYAQSVEVSGPARGVFSGLLAEGGEVVTKAGELRVDDRIGPEGRQHASSPAGVANGLVAAERIERRVGCGQHFETEAFIERARQKCGRLQVFRDDVVVVVSRAAGEPEIEAEECLKGVVEPHARRRAAKEIVLVGEDAPDPARVLHLVDADFEVVERDSLAVEHAVNVMIGLNEKLGRVRERFVLCKPGSLCVSMGAEDGQCAHAGVKTPGHSACGRVGREEAIFVKQGHVLPVLFFQRAASGGAARMEKIQRRRRIVKQGHHGHMLRRQDRRASAIEGIAADAITPRLLAAAGFPDRRARLPPNGVDADPAGS